MPADPRAQNQPLQRPLGGILQSLPPGWWREEAEALGLSLTSPGRRTAGAGAAHTTSSFSPSAGGVMDYGEFKEAHESWTGDEWISLDPLP